MLHAINPLLLPLGTVLHRHPSHGRLALLEAIQHTHELVVVRRPLGLDLRLRLVVLPQVGVPPVLIETRRRDRIFVLRGLGGGGW